MKIYTKSGDKGETSLIYGHRIPKDAVRVETYGTIDEANSMIGLGVAYLRDVPFRTEDLQKQLLVIQRDLFDLGRDLATPVEKVQEKGYYVGAKHVEQVEQFIDGFDAEVPQLTRFILPGGHKAAAALQTARTITRRAERIAVSLSKAEPVNPEVQRYLNRLSDYLFVVARAINHRAGTHEPEVDFTF
ncbi:cob(I)yrinic acid a,c-diamide adenosyltransferase [Tumebacillus permanentifrigoris]|uniref:Corrinoid adenosyltransferase n=1 Tax=Tumebacillus permanentifrigoris TaxID=378543 RepID=A0A316D583_9BACL|nr:cob(I)yrinic acid a,c-diamide adenosyltransferase [Tumebacillus permanentifrigoris]PWK08359.1 cob(I)alamin adenosyltransferase [Tumebacillus permanentifrigoris]